MIDLAITTGIVGVLLFVAAVVLWLRQAVQRMRRDDVYQAVGWVPAGVWWTVFFVGLLIIMWQIGWFIGVMLWLTAIYVTVLIAARYRQANSRVLVWSLAVATEKGIPLATAARAFSRERADDLGRRAEWLAASLEHGKSLDAALKTSGIRLPADALLAMRMGADTGMLSASLRGSAASSAKFDTAFQGIIGQIVYLMISILMIGCTLAFLLIKIIPAFVKILTDFKRPLPSSVVFLIQHRNLVAAVCAIAFLALIGLVLRYVGLVRWELPLVRRLWRQLDQANVLRALGLAVEHQRELPATLAALAEQYPKGHIRRRLRGAAGRVAAGGDWCDSLRATGLLDQADAGVLKAAQRVGNLGWALNETAERLVSRFITRMTAWTSIAFPVALLLIAFGVCLLAMSVFVPMVTIIRGLA